MSHFLDMGGYAAFVWSAYGASLLGLGAAIALAYRAYARAKASLAALERER